MPGLVKLGYTDRSPSERARELSSSTGVPEEFTVYAWWEILNTGAIELEKKSIKNLKMIVIEITENSLYLSQNML